MLQPETAGPSCTHHCPGLNPRTQPHLLPVGGWVPALGSFPTRKPTIVLRHLGSLSQLPQDPALPTSGLISALGLPGPCHQRPRNLALTTSRLALVPGSQGPCCQLLPHLPGPGSLCIRQGQATNQTRGHRHIPDHPQ